MGISGKFRLIGLEGNCLTISITEFIRDCGMWITMPFFALYFLALGGSITMLGLLGLLRALTGVFFQFFLGTLSDRIGKKKPVVIGGFIAAVGPLIGAFAPNWTFLILEQIIWSFQFATWNIREALFMDSVQPEKRGIGVASFQTIMRIGSLFMPFIGGIMLEWMGTTAGMRINYLFYSCTMIIQSVINAKYLKEDVIRQKEEEVATQPKDTHAFTTIKTFFQPLQVHKNLRIMLVGLISAAFARGLANNFLVIYATDIIKISTTEWGIIRSIGGGINLLTGIPFGRLVDKFGRKIFILISYFSRSLWIFLFSFSQNFPQALVIYSLDTLSMNLNAPAWQAMIADNTTQEDRGRTYSLFGMVSQISSQLSPSVGAVLWETFNPAAPILFDALIRGATAIFLLLFLKESTNS